MHLQQYLEQLQVKYYINGINVDAAKFWSTYPHPPGTVRMLPAAEKLKVEYSTVTGVLTVRGDDECL